jgi:GPH family glycoside/pentoside/hexuronide:cation symporter
MGRRRPWMLAGSLPLALSLVMLWSPPRGLEGSALIAWVCGSFLLFYTAITAVNVPHESLAAELSLDYRERTRAFAWRRVAFGVGALGAMAGVYLLTGFDLATEVGRDEARSMAFVVAATAAVVGSGLIAVSVFFVRERPEFAGRGSGSVVRAIGDVVRNPYARLIFVVFFIQQLGVISLTVSIPYFAQYVLHDERIAPTVIAVLFGGSLLAIPIWVRLAKHYEKKSLVMGSMIAVAAALGWLSGVSSDQVTQLYVAVALASVAVAALDVILPSMCADVIDYDELETGERKEGTYFAVWNFGQKTAAGVAGLGVSALLASAGYDRDVVPNEDVITAIRWGFADIPFVCFSLGTLLFTRFSLDSRRHAEIRAKIEERSGAAG